MGENEKKEKGKNRQTFLKRHWIDSGREEGRRTSEETISRRRCLNSCKEGENISKTIL